MLEVGAAAVALAASAVVAAAFLSLFEQAASCFPVHFVGLFYTRPVVAVATFVVVVAVVVAFCKP